MRILFVSHSFPPADRPLSNLGGMQRVATELDAALRAHREVGYSSAVLRSSWKWTHVKTGPFLLRTLFRILGAVQRDEVDAVLFSSMVSASLATLIQDTLRRRGVISAAIVHGRDVTLDVAPYQWLVPRIFDALDVVLPVSRATGEVCIERGLPRSKIQVVPNGVSMNRFEARRDDRARAALLERFDGSVPDAGLLLCSVGRQVKRKGFAWFVQHVMPLLPADVHYWLAGEGPEAEQITAAAHANGLSDRIRLLGRVTEEELNLLYSGSDLFMMPNVRVAGDMEGFGVVMLEAGLCGLPTVASRLEGITDVIQEGENGHLVDSASAWDFSEAIMQYYHDAEALQEAQRRASQFVSDHFSWRAVADLYVDALYGYVPAAPQATEATA